MNELMDISSITIEDLQEEYQKLKEKCSQLIALSDQDRQRIHELKRSLDTATAAEAYLSQELEQLSSVQTSQDDAALQKKQNEIDELKKRQAVLLTENEELHENVAALRADNERLKQEVRELNAASSPVEISYQIPKEYVDLRDKLETENLELLAKLDETHESVVKFTMALAEKEKHIEIFKDQVLCLEENLQSKREEVDEKTHLLESAQEQVVEMNAKIALLTSCPDNAERKGNSLFAEVDDQRQAMKQLLANQKKSYLQMKKIFNESQHEIRRLKRENVAMHTELQTCSTIFCSADKAYKEKLNERILQLLKQNEDLEKKLMFTQQELLSLANDKGVVWLDSMLLFCKQETDEMKLELHSIRIQKGILEEKLRNSQQELAKWRFEALKLRCILIDRETLLTDNHIEFKVFTNRDVSFSESELNNAKPQLTFASPHSEEDKSSKQNEIIDLDTSVAEKLEVSVIQLNGDEPTHDTNENKVAIAQEPTVIKVEEDQKTPIIKSVSIEIFEDEQLDCVVKSEPLESNTTKQSNNEITNSQAQLELNNPSIKTESRDVDNKENIFIAKDNEETLPNICAKITLKESNVNITTTTTTPEYVNSPKSRPSILVTKKDILADEGNTKTVHFTNSVTKSDSSAESKAASKPKRNKSSLVVRRILVGSKNKNTPSAPTIRH
ncbi:protein Spindly [Episyrphus balteatus]|uniref:protein Spindly n=1 Tax=Episyrphus balteatus TaxID=286459 RepID=UPI002485F671|nr:protein Spindly [Episyrphus balteatus]